MQKKKVMLCFYNGDISDDISILEELDSEGFEVHLFDNIEEDNLKIDELLNIIKQLFDEQSDNNIYLSSNIKEFIILQYILYDSCISGALYLNNNPINWSLENIYELILEKSLEKSAHNFYMLKQEDNIFRDYKIFKGSFEQTEKIYEDNRIYKFKEINHVFNIMNSQKIDVINLDDSMNSNVYEYHIDLNFLNEYIDVIKYYSNVTNKFINNYNNINLKLDEFKNKLLNLKNFEKEVVKFKLYNELSNDKLKDNYKIFLSSILLNIYNDKKYFSILIDLLTYSIEINKYNKFFAYYQCIRYSFVNCDIVDDELLIKRKNLYDKIVTQFESDYKEYNKDIKNKSNNNTIFVFTSQFLGINHAPTKLALDVSYNLINNLNKNVLLINTKEVLTQNGLIPMANIISGNTMDNLNNTNSVKYKDIKIPFYQPKCAMPSDLEIKNIFNMIEEYKPELIINIGTCLVGDLCTSIVPTVTTPLAKMTYSKSDFYVVNDLDEFDYQNKKYNRNSNSIIVSNLAFELKDKESNLNKEQLGIPDDKFVIALIGNRLNEEIDEKLLNVLDKSCKCNNAYIVFIGNFNLKSEYKSRHENLVNNCKNLGYQEDLMAVLENVDIYINPARSGGGISAIYALYCGKPVVTFNFGDVAIHAGKEFCVRNYDEMYETINKYCNKDNFYYKMSIIAKEKAVKLTDLNGYINNIYRKVMDKVNNL